MDTRLLRVISITTLISGFLFTSFFFHLLLSANNFSVSSVPKNSLSLESLTSGSVFIASSVADVEMGIPSTSYALFAVKKTFNKEDESKTRFFFWNLFNRFLYGSCSFSLLIALLLLHLFVYFFDYIVTVLSCWSIERKANISS